MSIGELRGEGLEVRGGADVTLAGLDVVVRAGESLAIRGPSASGKTTLLHALAGLAPLSGGHLEIDGRPAVPWRDARAGIVLQNLCLVPMLSAGETVALPLQAAGGARRGDLADRAREALARLGLADHARQLVGTLSGGQRQRVAVARALASEPDLILADEPTSALDEHWRAVVLAELRAHAGRGAVVIVASGDSDVADACDRVLELQAAVAR